MATVQVSPKEQFLDRYESEHATTMRVLRAYPPDKLDLQPHPKCKTARELAWMFVLERGLGKRVFQNAFAQAVVETITRFRDHLARGAGAEQ